MTEIKANIEAEIIDASEMQAADRGGVVEMLGGEVVVPNIKISDFTTNGLEDGPEDDDVALINPKTGEISAIFKNGIYSDDIVDHLNGDLIDQEGLSELNESEEPIDGEEPEDIHTAETREFFNPHESVHIDSPASDSDAGIVRSGILEFKTVLADGKLVQYAKAASAGFSVELGGFTAIDKDQSGKPVAVRVTDFYTDIDSALATVVSDDFGTYYLVGDKKLEINSGIPEISIGDIVKRRFVDGWKRS